MHWECENPCSDGRCILVMTFYRNCVYCERLAANSSYTKVYTSYWTKSSHSYMQLLQLQSILYTGSGSITISKTATHRPTLWNVWKSKLKSHFFSLIRFKIIKKNIIFLFVPLFCPFLRNFPLHTLLCTLISFLSFLIKSLRVLSHFFSWFFFIFFIRKQHICSVRDAYMCVFVFVHVWILCRKNGVELWIVFALHCVASLFVNETLNTRSKPEQWMSNHFRGNFYGRCIFDFICTLAVFSCFNAFLPLSIPKSRFDIGHFLWTRLEISIF